MRDDESTPCTGCRPEWKQRLRVKTALTSFFFVSFLFFAATNVACGQEVQGAQSLEDITVTANKVTLSPNKTEVFIKDYTIAGAPTTVFDILKDRAMIDFRGQSDLVPEPDTFQMRGFETRQFITAVDGLPIQKTGGWWGDHYLDYAMVPLSAVESVEFLYGPHSALYDGKSFGGVINFKLKQPAYYDKARMTGNLSASIRNYGTQSQKIALSGGKSRFNIDMNYERYRTDGYLRNGAADIDTMAASLGYVLPSDGHIRLTATWSDLMRKIPSANDPKRPDYDSSYPVVLESDVSYRWRNPADHSGRDYDGHSIRVDFKQPSGWGDWNVGAYYTDEGQHYYRNGFDYSHYDTNYVSYGALVKNRFFVKDVHEITIGMDTAHLFQKYSEKIVETWAGFIQDKWEITGPLTLTTGLRLENINIWWDNWWSPSSKYPGGAYKDPSHPSRQVKKNYQKIVPKSFLTYRMDHLVDWLRDTSLSAGLSKIWTPRAFCEV